MKNDNISIILVNPQLAENIGSCARAMLNFGLTDLRLVKPRSDVQMDKALAFSAHAKNVIEKSVTYQTFEQAITDKKNLYATTARKRDMQKEVVSTKNISTLDLQDSAFVFGCEASGLNNNVVSQCDKIISIPVGSEYASLNLAQAVVITAYELIKNTNISSAPRAQKADKAEFNNLLDFLKLKMQEKEFYQDINKQPGIEQSLTNIFNKAEMTSQEVRLLRGIFKKIT